MTEQVSIFPHGGVTNAAKQVSGTHTTVAAEDSIQVNGMRRILAVTVTLRDDPSDDPISVTADFADTVVTDADSQSFTLKSWKNTSGSDPTPAPATTFGKRVSWSAVGY